MKFGELINKSRIVILVFDHTDNLLSKELTTKLYEKQFYDEVVVNSILMVNNMELCKSLRIKGKTIIIYNFGQLELRLDFDNLDTTVEKINEYLETQVVTK